MKEKIEGEIHIAQNVDVFTTDKCHYLSIQKNASTRIRDYLTLNFSYVEPWVLTGPLNSPLPYWTTIRDPYDRFISGLSYDLYQNQDSIPNLPKFLDEVDIFRIFYDKLPIQYKSITKGKLNHTLLQWTYLFNQKINFYLDIKDLDLFADFHFPLTSHKKMNETPLEFKEILIDYVNSNSKFKNIVNNYLAPDYYIINQIHNSGLIWGWQDGKMF